MKKKTLITKKLYELYIEDNINKKYIINKKYTNPIENDLLIFNKYNYTTEINSFFFDGHKHGIQFNLHY